MKKLTKLNINPEKVIKSEELNCLKGGSYDTPCCYCYNEDGSWSWGVWGVVDQTDCNNTCVSAGKYGGQYFC